MAILALASSREDLRARLGAIVVGATRGGRPVRASELDATGAMMALLNEAVMPNLVQTTEGTPALVHTGPFGNIAHGTSSVISQDMGLRLADYVVNEAGFGADLGAEKYIDIVMRSSGICPSAAVLVTTVQSLRNQGEGDLERGFANLAKHIDSLRRFGLPTVVAVNRFPNDTTADLDRMIAYCAEQGVLCSLTEAFAKGGAGTTDLAQKVVDLIDSSAEATVAPIYSLWDPLEEKIQKVATQIYGAAGVVLNAKAKTELQRLVRWGFGELPVCIAKTQYSLSDNPKLLGAPTDWVLQVTGLSLSAGAGFIVVIAGNMMLMPGLPKLSRAASIDVTPDGEIIGV
jgi:formate--tetrahydrofolate ligase